MVASSLLSTHAPLSGHRTDYRDHARSRDRRVQTPSRGPRPHHHLERAGTQREDFCAGFIAGLVGQSLAASHRVVKSAMSA